MTLSDNGLVIWTISCFNIGSMFLKPLIGYLLLGPLLLRLYLLFNSWIRNFLKVIENNSRC